MYVPNHMADNPWQPYYAIWSHTASNDVDSKMSVYSQLVVTGWHGVHIPQDLFQNENILKVKHSLQISDKLHAFVKYPLKIHRKNLTLAISKGFREHHFSHPRGTLLNCDGWERYVKESSGKKKQLDRPNSAATGHSNTDCNIRTIPLLFISTTLRFCL